MLQQMLMAASGPALLTVDAADFDGSADYMTRGADLTGSADSKSGIFSAWVWMDASAAVSYTIMENASSSVDISYSGASDDFQFGLRNGAGTLILVMETTATYGISAWRHLLASWNLATPISHLYINDVSDKSAATETDDTINYTVADWTVGGSGTVPGTLLWDGRLAELYFAQGQYLDFSLVANRRKFISASGKPVHLGATGALPTGTAPIVYCHLDDGEAVANFATNRGSGGDFTITGTLGSGVSSPSD